MVEEKKLYTSMNEAVFYYCIGNNPEMAKIFIEQVIKKKIHKLEMKNPKLLKDYMNAKERTLDYLVLTDEGYINIEINNYYEDWRINRDITYACKVLTNSVDKKKEYKDMPKVTQININRLGKDKGAYEVYKLNSTNNTKGFAKTLSNIIEIYMLNIDFYKEMVYNGNKKFICDNYLLCAMDLQPEDIDNILEGNEVLMEYKKNLEKINDNEDFVKWISSEEEAEMFERTRILVAEERAIERGLKKGIEQGIQQGIQQGQRSKQTEIAKNLLKENIDINIISLATGLNIDELNKLDC